jgi:hypothetical protein
MHRLRTKGRNPVTHRLQKTGLLAALALRAFNALRAFVRVFATRSLSPRKRGPGMTI